MRGDAVKVAGEALLGKRDEDILCIIE
uniref:10 kDa chaperonin n=1 Tax=Ralstonia solanacearum TaxID=305 RepID=A0A0S4U0A1_RALSL